MEIESCLRSSDPSFTLVPRAKWVHVKATPPPSERPTIAFAESTRSAAEQTFGDCLEAAVQRWELADRATSPALMIRFQLAANTPNPPSETSLAGVPSVVVDDGRVRVFYDPGFMWPPEFVSGPDPHYTLAGWLDGVQGTLVAKCIVDVQGRVQKCRVIEKLPRMNDATLEALEARRYKPARWNNDPIQVDYTFIIRFWL